MSIYVQYISCTSFILSTLISRNFYPSLLPAPEMSRVFEFHELEFGKERDSLQAITMVDI
jgi:hypothetical protein